MAKPSLVKKIQAEIIDNNETDLEVETLEDEDNPEERKPWDPDQIRIHTKNYSLRQINDMISDGDLDLAPDFQRSYVWKDKQKSRLIESILLGIPLPSFYLTEDEEGSLQVVDGLQRLSTIYGFARKKDFVLDDLEYLLDLKGSSYEKMPQVFRRRFDGAQISANVIDPQTPFPVKFDVFKRINTGGSPLNSQEIRHCMSSSKARAVLSNFAKSDDFQKATSGAMRDHLRMADKEIVLRFCAFWKLGVDGYRKHGTFDSFLVDMLDVLDKMPTKKIEEMLQKFNMAMSTAFKIFGSYSFRKRPKGVDWRNPINRALFEVWAVVFAKNDPKQLIKAKKKIVSAGRKIMTSDEKFIAAISQGTGDIRKVEYRFKKVEEIVDEAIGK